MIEVRKTLGFTYNIILLREYVDENQFEEKWIFKECGPNKGLGYYAKYISLLSTKQECLFNPYKTIYSSINSGHMQK